MPVVSRGDATLVHLLLSCGDATLVHLLLSRGDATLVHLLLSCGDATLAHLLLSRGDATLVYLQLSRGYATLVHLQPFDLSEGVSRGTILLAVTHFVGLKRHPARTCGRQGHRSPRASALGLCPPVRKTLTLKATLQQHVVAGS